MTNSDFSRHYWENNKCVNCGIVRVRAYDSSTKNSKPHYLVDGEFTPLRPECARKTGYHGVHKWVERQKGKASCCEICGKNDKSMFNWALKRGCAYEKNSNNFFSLCVPCHRIYDNRDEDGNLIVTGKDGGCRYRRRSVVKKQLNGEIIAEYPSISIAATETGILVTSITNNLKGRSKRAGGFKWDYKNK